MSQKFLSSLFFVLIFSLNGFSQNWLTNFDKAKEIAKKENKPIILVFQGSDWCAPCIKLDHEIFSSEEFKKYANEHYVMLKADFPRKKANALPKDLAAANEKLAETYNKDGVFPLVVNLNYDGKVKGVTGYKKCTPQTYIEYLNSFTSN